MNEIIENCCSKSYLDMIAYAAKESSNWNLKHPIGHPLENKHLKLTVIENEPVHELLAGMAMGLLIQIYEKSSSKFYPEVSYCGISIKDKYRKDNRHTDHEKDFNYVKIFGVLNTNWNKKDGGFFIHGDDEIIMKPTDFVVFDPRVPHSASEIFTNEKRLGIDFTVRKK